MRTAALAVLLSLALSTAAAAREPMQPPGLPRPNEIRIEGYAGRKPAGMVPEADWLVSCLGQEYHLYVTKLRVILGDLSYSDIIQEVQPYRIAFYLRGDEPTLQRFAHAAAAGEPLAITAYERTGSRDLLVAQVEPLGATPAP